MTSLILRFRNSLFLGHPNVCVSCVVILPPEKTTTQNVASLDLCYRFNSWSHKQYISYPVHCLYLFRSTVHMEEKPYMLRIGSLLVHNFGQLLPYQIQTNKFNTRDSIYPVSCKVPSPSVTELYLSNLCNIAL